MTQTSTYVASPLYVPSSPQTQEVTANQPQYTITPDDKKRIDQISDAWKAYEGCLAPPLQNMPDGTNPNVMTNRMQAVVDRGLDFLFGKELEISVDEDAPEEAQTFLDTSWGRKE